MIEKAEQRAGQREAMPSKINRQEKDEWACVYRSMVMEYTRPPLTTKTCCKPSIQFSVHIIPELQAMFHTISLNHFFFPLALMLSPSWFPLTPLAVLSSLPSGPFLLTRTLNKEGLHLQGWSWAPFSSLFMSSLGNLM